jgi:hypothetical protein
MRLGIYPGSFNPLTIAHLGIAEAALRHRRLDRVDLAVSRKALNKEHVDRPRFEDRMAVLHEAARNRRWLGVVTTDAQLLVDIAEGYDVLVMGADKWAQVNDPRYYGDSEAARDDAVARLPELAVAPRPPAPVPPRWSLHLPEHLTEVSSSDVRAGRHEWMAPEARAFDERTGAWSDPDRYERWLADR